MGIEVVIPVRDMLIKTDITYKFDIKELCKGVIRLIASREWWKMHASGLRLCLIL